MVSSKDFLGNKGKFLLQMKEYGFNVPKFFIITTEDYLDILEVNNIKNPIEKLLETLNNKNIKEVSKKLINLISNAKLPIKIIKKINENIDTEKAYAVRSSGAKEDLKGISFAGQYSSFLNLSTLEAIKISIIDCYKSMFSEKLLKYFLDNKLKGTDLKMAVIVQEMIDSEISGVAFTINPLTGNDKEIIVEVAEGIGEALVSGRVNPEAYKYNWFNEKYDYPKENKLLDKEKLSLLMNTLLDIQLFFGYPCDIEFAFYKDDLYILQARPITKILYSSIEDQWTTANFKDGGVSARSCKPYMWSLYEYIWEHILKKFLIDAKLFKEKDLRKLGNIFYGRPYWNLSIVKAAMANIPGYKEREFDSELGVTISYDGDGETTKVTVKSLLKIVQIAKAQGKIRKNQMENIIEYRDSLLEKYNEYVQIVENLTYKENIEGIWYKLIKDDYFKSECTYFWQIFINTIEQPLYKKGLPKTISNSEYLNLMGGLQQIPHLRPVYDLWEISRLIRGNKEAQRFWNNNSIEEIASLYKSKDNSYYLDKLKKHVENYGYHSESELDVSYPCYIEEPSKVIRLLKETILLDDSFSPIEFNKVQQDKFNSQLEELESRLSDRKYNTLIKRTNKIRKMMWWREELKDISIGFYYIIRIYTVFLSEEYLKRGLIRNIDDIWFLPVNVLFAFIEGKVDEKYLKKELDRNKKYYNSFRHFMSENEIGKVYDNKTRAEFNNESNIVGLGCNNGVVTGKARVIESVNEINKLKPGDILVTKYTDTGWTSNLAVLKGIVTECGGVLCHASIIAREYGIPCIVSCTNVTTKIEDGDIITINGTTGEVFKGGIL